MTWRLTLERALTMTERERDTARAELLEIVRIHDGVHSEDCRAYGAGINDADLPEEPSDADPACTCGATRKREHARRVAKGLPVWDAEKETTR